MAKKDRFAFFLLTFFLTSVYFFLLSSSGYLERKTLLFKYDSLVSKIENLSKENNKLEKRISNYKFGKITDPDLFRSGFISTHSYALIFDKSKIYETEDKIIKEDKTIFKILYLKIIWIFLSLFLIYKFYNKKKSRVEVAVD